MHDRVQFRVATRLENLGNLEKSGNLRVVREKRKSQGKCVLAYGQLLQVLILTQNVQKKELFTRYSCASHEVWKKNGIFLHAGSYIEHSVRYYTIVFFTWK